MASTDYSQSAELTTIANPLSVPSDLADATLQSQCVLMPPSSDLGRLQFSILGCLQLSAAQMKDVQGFIRSYENCIKGVRDSLRISELKILICAKTRINEIMDSVKAGTLSKADAGKEIQAVNERTRHALKNNPVLDWANASMKVCRDNLYASIRGILTDAQKVLWDTWVSTGQDCHRKWHGIDSIRQHQLDSLQHYLDSLRHHP